LKNINIGEKEKEDFAAEAEIMKSKINFFFSKKRFFILIFLIFQILH
jgi:hypothetical protein